MKIVFRKSCDADLKWFRTYYASVFPEGAIRAKTHFASTYKALSGHPFIGHPVEGVPHIREFHIPQTPFSLIYVVTENEILVLRLLDNRAERPQVFPSTTP